MKEKWKLVDKIKTQSTRLDYLMRINKALSDQMRFDVSSVCSFIDLDTVAGHRAIDAARHLADQKRVNSRIDFVIAMQTLKGVLTPEEKVLLNSILRKLTLLAHFRAQTKAEKMSILML